MEYCRLIQKRVKEYLNLTISIGISNRFETLNESKQSVDRAKEALYYRVNTGQVQLFLSGNRSCCS